MNNWVKINKMSDMAKFDGSFVAFIINDEDERNIDNLYGDLGFLTCSKDKTYCSIISDGEIYYLHDIDQLCKIPCPIGLYVGSEENG